MNNRIYQSPDLYSILSNRLVRIFTLLRSWGILKLSANCSTPVCMPSSPRSTSCAPTVLTSPLGLGLPGQLWIRLRSKTTRRRSVMPWMSPLASSAKRRNATIVMPRNSRISSRCSTPCGRQRLIQRHRSIIAQQMPRRQSLPWRRPIHRRRLLRLQWSPQWKDGPQALKRAYGRPCPQ